VDVVAVADPDEEGRGKAASEVGAQNTYADYREMLDRENLDLVTVGPRWVDCHEEMVLACIDAGCHIYCEKPMAASLDAADRMVAAAGAAGVKLAVAHQGVYLPQVGRVKEMLVDGAIGPVLSVHATGKQDRRGGGEDMIVLGTHLLNMMRYLAGDVAWVSSHVTAGGRELAPGDVREAGEPVGPIAGDSVESHFSFVSGVSGSFLSRADQAGGGKSYGLEIVGGEGRIALRGGSASPALIYPHGLWAPENSSQTWESIPMPDASLADGNRLAVEDLIQAAESGRDPVSSGRDATAALEMILGAYESQITGARVMFPMKKRVHPLEGFRESAATEPS
jgi:predicted dehydrogenase